MKQVYNSLTHKPGVTNAAICSIMMAAKEWLANPISLDFNTGTCTLPAVLLPGKDWIVIECTPTSLEYEERQKNSRAGDYIEVGISGIINNMDANLQQSIDSLKNHEMVVVIEQKNKLKKIIGNTVKGMLFNYSNNIQNSNGGTEVPTFELLFQSPNIPPYYSI